jgi:hypothetical protein
MNKTTTLGKILRSIAILLMGVTAAFTLLGGIGTSCVALAAENYESMAALVPYKWLYQIFVLLTIFVAVAGIRATVGLIKRKGWSYTAAIIALVSGLLLAGVQIAASRMLRGKSQPNDIRFYLTLLTLVVFLLLRIPALWNQARLSGGGGSGSGTAAGLTLILTGTAILTVHLWAGATHIFGGTNFADVWHTQLAVAGWALVASGVIYLLWLVVRPATISLRSSTAAGGLQRQSG